MTTTVSRSNEICKMDQLAESVTRSIENLKEKNDFLLQQRDHYLDIRERMLTLRGSRSEDGEDEMADNDSGLALGDVIISAKKVYMNIGYEYFVEKNATQVLDYSNEKLRLIEEALGQFGLKIKEGKETLINIQNWTDLEDSEVLPDDFEGQHEHLPSMEIREELDEEGNVVNSSVTPTSTERLRETLGSQKKQEETETKTLNQLEENIKGKLAPKQKEKKKESNNATATNQLRTSDYNPIDTENAYTFADLVRQMDEQDEEEDEDADFEEINYDFDSFDQHIDSIACHESENDEDESDEDEHHYSVFPNMESHNAFMSQVRKLREGRKPANRPDEKPVEAPKKSILKNKNDSRPKRPKKSVGFASELDIHEVENLKHENQINTHMFPRSLLQPLEHEADDENVEFDSDLFAQLIGAQGPDEIHEKYKNEVSKEQDMETVQPSDRKKRVSRFRQERRGHSDSFSSQAEVYDEPIISSLVVEKAVEQGESDDVSSVGTIGETAHTQTTGGVNLDNEPVVAEKIVDREDVSTDVVDLGDDIEEPSVSDVVIERDVSEPLASSSKDMPEKLAPLFKTMKSLRPPRKSRAAKSPKLEELFDSSEDELAKTEPRTKDQTSEIFPPEIMERINRKEPVQLPHIDYNALNDDLDSMARAYALGVYDDDLDDDPGVLLEKVSDFKAYNDQVEQLKDEIKEFKLTNPMEQQGDQQVIESNSDDDDDDDGPLMTDITENDIPESYGKSDLNEDLALNPERLHESIAVEYSRLREVILSRAKHINAIGNDEEQKQIEPLDENGHPIKQSRFRSQRFGLGK